MNTVHTKTTRVQVDESYAALVGKAVYVFAYYEWVIIGIVEALSGSFVNEYSRGNPLTSGAVEKRFRAVLEDPKTDFSQNSKQDLQQCVDCFGALVVRRNALIHAHPCTDADGVQILSYQTKLSKPLPDIIWRASELESLIATFDAAACEASSLFDRLRKGRA